MTRRTIALILLLALAIPLASCNEAVPAAAVKVLRRYIQEQGSGEYSRIHQATPLSRYGFEEEWCVWVVEEPSRDIAPSGGEEPRLAAYYLVRRDDAWQIALDPMVTADGWSLWKYDLQCPMAEQTE